MSNHTPLTAGSVSRSYRVAQLLSQIFHPILVNIASFVLTGLLTVRPLTTALGWSGVCVLLQIVPGTIFFVVRRRQGAYSDADVSVRQQRNELYLFGIAMLLVGLAILWLIGAPAPFLALMSGALAIGVVNGLINLRWKISAHAASVGTLATVAALYAPLLGAVLWVCALAVSWARVRTGNHTPAQVAAGLAVAAALIVAAFRLVVY